TKTLLTVQWLGNILEFIEEYTIDVEDVGHVFRPSPVKKILTQVQAILEVLNETWNFMKDDIELHQRRLLNNPGLISNELHEVTGLGTVADLGADEALDVVVLVVSESEVALGRVELVEAIDDLQMSMFIRDLQMSRGF
ncbi:hypothetical protein Tco_1007367, partial [Tanacetum coccineum]